MAQSQRLTHLDIIHLRFRKFLLPYLKLLYMEPIQPPPFSKPNVVPPPPVPPYGVFGTKIPSVVAFTIGILLFFLPFAEIKCNGNVYAKNSGFGIAIGKAWTSIERTFGNRPNETTKTEGNQKNDPNPYAIVGLALGVIGLVLSFANARAAIGGALISGILATAALIGLLFDLNKQVRDPNPVKHKIGTELDSTLKEIKVTIDFTPWFYIAVISFLAASFFCYKRMQATKQ